MDARITVEIATSVDELESRTKAWNALEARAADDNAFVSAPFLTTAAHHFGAPFRVAFAYDESCSPRELVGVAPFTLLPRTRLAPFQRLSTFQCTHTFLPTPMLDRTRADAAASAIWEWIDGPDRPWGLVVVEQIDTTSATWSAFSRKLHERGRRPWIKRYFPQAALDRGPSFDEYFATLSRNARKNYRRKRGKIDQFGMLDVVLHRNLEKAPDLADRFLDLETRAWQSKANAHLGADSRDVAFFRDVVAEMAKTDRLFFLELRLNEQTIAMNLSFVGGQTMFGYRVAFDEAFRDLSPGAVACVEEVRCVYESADLCRAQSGTDIPDSYMFQYWPGSIRMYGMTIPTAKLSARAYTALAPPFFRIVERMRHKKGAGDPSSIV